MSAASLAERARLGRLMAVDAWHAFLRRLTYYSVSWDALSLFDKAELRLVPQDIRTADPTIAEDIYAGRFAFAGEVIEERTQSPFEIIPPNPTWAEELHAFSWLRHLRASERAIAQANAQALVLDWIETTRLTNPYAWTPAILSTRILAWISQAPLILTDCDVAFYQKFARSLSRQVRFLRKSINNAPDGLTRVKAAIALCAASIAISNQTRFRRPSLRRLDQELQRQILPDGGHFSRNPAPIIEILLDLIPLRQAILAAQMVPSQTLMNAIDRMIPMIRFFQLGDGAFARFNGMGGTPVDLVAAILAHDDARGAPPLNASHSGYQRLQSDATILIVDTGAPPPVGVSEQAHAGCLSFEMSAGNRPLIVNCGRPHDEHATLRRLARTTAAHSTLTLGNGSSCRFAPLTRFTASRGLPILSGPAPPDVVREDIDGRTSLRARHDGYKRTAGYLHERSITLHAGGLLVEGLDSLIEEGQKPEGDRDFAIRFHLHPFVRPGPIEPGGSVRLTLRGGQVWRFSASGSEMAVEESVYLSDIVGSLKTRQIVLYGRPEGGSAVRWRLERLADLDILAGFAVEDGPFAIESDRVEPEPGYTAVPVGPLDDPQDAGSAAHEDEPEVPLDPIPTETEHEDASEAEVADAPVEEDPGQSDEDMSADHDRSDGSDAEPTRAADHPEPSAATPEPAEPAQPEPVEADTQAAPERNAMPDSPPADEAEPRQAQDDIDSEDTTSDAVETDASEAEPTGEPDAGETRNDPIEDAIPAKPGDGEDAQSVGDNDADDARVDAVETEPSEPGATTTEAGTVDGTRNEETGGETREEPTNAKPDDRAETDAIGDTEGDEPKAETGQTGSLDADASTADTDPVDEDSAEVLGSTATEDPDARPASDATEQTPDDDRNAPEPTRADTVSGPGPDAGSETPTVPDTEPTQSDDTPAASDTVSSSDPGDRIGPPREDGAADQKDGGTARRPPSPEFGTEFFMDDEFDLTFNVPPSMQLRPPGGPVKLPKAERKNDNSDEPDTEK